MEEKFFTTEQVANILQVHPFTILKFIKSGKLQGIKIGRVYRIKESAIDSFLEERMTKGKNGNGKNKVEENTKVESEKDLAPKENFSKETQIEDGKELNLSNSDHYYII